MTDDLNTKLLNMAAEIANWHNDDGPTILVENVIVIADVLTEGGDHGIFTAATPMPSYRALGMLQAELLSLKAQVVSDGQ